MSSEIPEIPQAIIRDLADKAEQFVAFSRAGGSWLQIHTWLLMMQPSFDALNELGIDDIRRTARMPISQAVQDEILADFEVPDTVPTEREVL